MDDSLYNLDFLLSVKAESYWEQLREAVSFIISIHRLIPFICFHVFFQYHQLSFFTNRGF